ncbi:MAG TPA: TetR/AcrR family transcriptional regulator [Acidimicrobiales bacterium]|nr:TetR/AcrR family transcriptional regulator [Acidimicrobiales bacterium]
MPSSRTTLDRAGGGRPLDTTRDEDLRQAALELVAEMGYDRLTIDAVAARVKASKATVYRRWNSKAELVADAFAYSGFAGVEPPDTGDLRSDLLTLAERVWLDDQRVPRSAVMAGMLSAMLANPELRDALKTMAAPPVTATTIIRRAVERGDIPPPDHLETVLSVIPGLCMFRLMKTGIAPDRAFFETVIDAVILPALHYSSAKSGSKATPKATSKAKKGRT